MNRPVFGWEEWALLPALGAPALKAKLDTGARTSALHAVDVEVFGPGEARKVRFVLPAAGGGAGALCEVELWDRRGITCSNGSVEVRLVIRTPVKVGEAEQEVEISLTDRSAMTYPLLLGRLALRAFGALLDPGRRCVQGGSAALPPVNPGARVSAPDGLG